MFTGKAPWVEIETSCFAEQWLKMVQTPQHSDVVFVVEGKHRLSANKVVLSAASSFFAKVLSVTESNQVCEFHPL